MKTFTAVKVLTYEDWILLAYLADCYIEQTSIPIPQELLDDIDAGAKAYVERCRESTTST